MSMCVLLALAVHGHVALKQPVSGAMVWEELPYVQRRPGYHPILRFGSWEIIRFNMSTTYLFETPGFIQEGQFQAQDGHYTFRAVMANELENADIAKLTANMNPDAAQELAKKYAKSMSNFEGDYDDRNKVFTISYPVNGSRKTFELHQTNEGDDGLTATVSDDERGFIGLWHGAEPYPDKLDARTRAKIGDIEGLQQFAGEAGASDGAQLNILDLKPDGNFRLHKTLGRWRKKGSILALIAEGSETDFTVSADRSKLLLGGKPIYARD